MQSVRRVLNPEELPEIGTPEAAVCSCVSLISGMCSQPESIMAYWLDLYYQVRLRYEIDGAAARFAEAPGADTPEEAGPGDEPPVPAPVSAEEYQEAPEEPAKRAKRGAPKGNTNAFDAAVFKRETADRLRRLRKDGLTIAELMELSNRKLSENVIMEVLECKKVPIAAYYTLAAALDKYETK